MASLDSQGSSSTAGFWWGLLGAFLILALTHTGLWQPQPGQAGLLIGRTLAITWLMAIWWMTEALPIPVTSLIPLVLFPLAGIMPSHDVAHEYMNEVIFLFMGGFFLALALQKWGVHRRIALHLVLRVGTQPQRIILGFMVACAFLSMWINNTATVLMLLPIALSVIQLLRDEQSENAHRAFSLVLLLGIAYASSLGGMATLVGTAPNLSMARIYKIYFPQAPEISFLEWMKIALPITLCLVPLFWALMVFFFFRQGFQDEKAKADEHPHTPNEKTDEHPHRQETALREWLHEQLRSLGSMSRQERTVIILFGLTVALWLTRADLRLGEQLRIPGWMTLLKLHHHVKETRYLPLSTTNSPTTSTTSPTTSTTSLVKSPSSTAPSQISPTAALHHKTAPRAEVLYQRQEISRKRPLVGDGFVAMLMALLLFLWPAGEGRRLLDWDTALEIPWGMLLLFGGGFALAAGIKISGTSSWIGEIFRWKGLASFPTFGIILFLCLIITFLTEFTSNTATTEISLAMIAPVIATFGGTGVHPYLLMIPITLSASCAFMMPVATPPNAIVYASGLVPMREMVRLGFKLNLISALLISLLLYAVFLWMGIPLREKPPWL